MKYLKDLDVNNKTVLVRVDFNVPIKDGVVTDNNRIKASLETINYLLEKGAKVILMSHLGKVKTEEDKVKNDMKYVVGEVSRLLNREVKFSFSPVGEELENLIKNLTSGEVLLVQNTRWLDLDGKLESGCDENLSKYWASLVDCYVMDAFGSAHRAHASTCGVAKYTESAIGPLMMREMTMLDEVIEAENKIAILGGAKAEDKIKMIDNLAPKSKYILIGGLMSAPFLSVKGYNTGACAFSEEAFNEAKMLLEKYGDKIVLPVDFITAKSEEAETVVKDIESFENDDLQFDVGPKTIELFKEKLFESTMIFWNGPLGLFENPKYEKGALEILELLSDFNAKVILAGGDTGNAAKKMGLDSLFVISTGGGASLEYLGGDLFPILEVLGVKKKN